LKLLVGILDAGSTPAISTTAEGLIRWPSKREHLLDFGTPLALLTGDDMVLTGYIEEAENKSPKWQNNKFVRKNTGKSSSLTN
jgi:hypothetical protein